MRNRAIPRFGAVALALVLALAACGGGTDSTATPIARATPPHSQAASTAPIDEAASGDKLPVQPASNTIADAPVSGGPDKVAGQQFASDSVEAMKMAQMPTEQRAGISVSGEGMVEARPDTAYITLGFTAENQSVGIAQKEAAQNMSAIVEKLKALGIAEKDIQTANYSIHRDQDHNRFVVSNDVRVVIRDVQASSTLLDGAVAAGANSVHGISFGIEDHTVLEKQARGKAMQDAREKATELARLASVTLGGPTAISEVAPPGPVVYAEAMARDLAAGSQTPVEPGELTVRMSVNVTYAIEQ